MLGRLYFSFRANFTKTLYVINIAVKSFDTDTITTRNSPLRDLKAVDMNRI